MELKEFFYLYFESLWLISIFNDDKIKLKINWKSYLVLFSLIALRFGHRQDRELLGQARDQQRGCQTVQGSKKAQGIVKKSLRHQVSISSMFYVQLLRS